MGQFKLEQSNMMAKYLLIVASVLVSFQHSNSRPDYVHRLSPFVFSANNPKAFAEDIIKDARTQSNALKKTLRFLSRKPEAEPILNRVFAKSNNDCIKTMDDAIDAIDTSVKLFENAGHEIKALIQTVQIFQNVTDVSEAVRGSAQIIRILDVLIPKLSPPTSVCKDKNADVIGSMRSLGSLVEDLSSKDDLYYSPQVRQTLTSSAQIMSKVTKFLAMESHFKFEHFCTKEKEHNMDFIAAVGKMMSDLADLYTDLGGFAAAYQMKLYKDFIQKTMDTLDKVEDLGDLGIFSLDCINSDSSSLVADTLEGLADIIDDIGMESLCSQLGLDSSVCTFYL